MTKARILGGIDAAHPLPRDLKKALSEDDVTSLWNDLTELARNEFICWVVSPKAAETRQRRINRTIEELREGQRRPCCWMGCVHRPDKELNSTLKWLTDRQSHTMTSYADSYRDIDFRKYPEKYLIGRGEQGVLIAEPYKSEILPHWRFKTPESATKSAKKIYAMFVEYGKNNEFVGMDMARKFLQMGFTRARRYANHPSGTKYRADGSVDTQATDWKDSEKAKSAAIFKTYYDKARQDPLYLRLKSQHKKL